jgi:hypothetical protein
MVVSNSSDIYADAIPDMVADERRTVRINGIAFLVMLADVCEPGFHTGRCRYRVECTACGSLVHEATTGPCAMAWGHLGRCQALAGLAD